MIERSQHRDLLGLSRRRDAQIGSRLCPGAGEVGMRQGLALVAVEKNDVARFRLLFAQLQAKADPLHLAGALASLQCVPRSPSTELFFRKALDSCERLMRTPSRASLSARRRGIVQLRRSATGSSSNGMATRNAAALFTGVGPGATVAFNSSTPPLANALRHRRTVSSVGGSARNNLNKPTFARCRLRRRPRWPILATFSSGLPGAGSIAPRRARAVRNGRRMGELRPVPRRHGARLPSV